MDDWKRRRKAICGTLAKADGKPLSKKTRLNVYTALRLCFAWAKNQGLIAVNPFPEESGLGDWQTSRKPLSDADATAILANCSPEFALIFSFIRATGCRPSEACNLTADDLKADTIDGESFPYFDLSEHKNAGRGDARIIDLTVFSEVKASTLSLCETRKTGNIFLNEKGEAWTPDALQDTVYRLRKAGKVSGEAVMYGLRHAKATSLYNAGNSLEDMGNLLGNGSAVLKRCYIHKNSMATRHSLRQRAGKASA